MWYISYWILPLAAACVWLATLITLLVRWHIDGSPVYASMEPGQTVAYISDVAAQGLKPLFVAGCAVSSVLFVLAFISERWLRHKRRLVPNKGKYDKILSLLAILFSIVGALGLILLAHYDTLRHSRLHSRFLAMFIFVTKLLFIIVELALAITYGVLGKRRNTRNVAAILEWVIAFIFALYALSYVVDLFPAVKTKSHIPQGERVQGMAQSYPSQGSGSYPSSPARMSQEAQLGMDPMSEVGNTYRGRATDRSRIPAAVYDPNTYRQTPMGV